MSSGTLVLSLFPGIGLLDMAFEEEGFCVVRGPDLLWGGDVRRFHPPAGRFDGVIGGPPCQFWSAMKRINPRCGEKHGDMIPDFCRVVLEAEPEWFVMENVEGAPRPMVGNYYVHSQFVKDVWVGGVTMRKRRFSWGLHEHSTGNRILGVEQIALHTLEPDVSALAGNCSTVPVALQRDGNGGHKVKKRRENTGPRSALWNSGGGDSFASKLKQQGLPDDFLSEAPFTASGKSHAVGNGVPLPMGRAVAKAVKRAMGYEFSGIPQLSALPNTLTDGES